MMEAWADYLDAVAETGKVDLPAPDMVKSREERGIQSYPIPLLPSIGSGASLYRIIYLNDP